MSGIDKILLSLHKDPDAVDRVISFGRIDLGTNPTEDWANALFAFLKRDTVTTRMVGRCFEECRGIIDDGEINLVLTWGIDSSD